MTDSNRLALQTRLEELLGSDNVYFQPPGSTQMKYPCIKYDFHKGETNHAGNRPYSFFPIYDVTVIEKNPENSIARTLAKNLEGSRYDRGWGADNLYHNNFVVCYPHG